MSMPIAATAFLVFSSVVFGTLALALSWEVINEWRTQREVNKRLRPVLQEDATLDKAAADLVHGLDGDRGVLGMAAQSLPGLQRAENLLEQARVDLRPETFLMVSTGLAAGCALAAYLVFGSLFAVALAAALGSVAPYLHVRRRRSRRLALFEEQLPEAIDLLTRAIRAGHPLASGIRMVADEGPPTIAVEFRQVFEEQRYGFPLDDALLSMVRRVDLLDLRIFVVAVLIQREVGGNLAEILDNIAETIRGRFYIRRQLRTYTAQGRMSGITLFAIPIVVGVATYLIQPEHVGLLFNNIAGLAMVTVAIVLQIIGGLWIRKIVDIEV